MAHPGTRNSQFVRFSLCSFFLTNESLINMEDAILGFPIPFPKEDLFTALIAVASFIPIIIITTRIVTTILGLFNRKPKQQ